MPGRGSGSCTRARQTFSLVAEPPRSPDGVGCRVCVNACVIGAGQVGYCGVRRMENGRLIGGDSDSAAVQWYYDPLPTNGVADWVCPASGPAGYPDFTDTKGPERGDYKPTPAGNLYSFRSVPIPDFGWADAPAPPAVPPGNPDNQVPCDRAGRPRTPHTPIGAFI